MISPYKYVLISTRIINGSVCNEVVTIEKNDFYEFVKCKNKFGVKYRKHVYIWKNTIFHGFKKSKHTFIKIIKLCLQKVNNKAISYILRVS